MESSAMTDTEIAAAHKHLLRVAGKYRNVSNALDPEDLVHDAWVAALPRLDSLPGPDDRIKLLTTIVRNLGINALRRRRRIAFSHLEDWVPANASVESEALARHELGGLIDAARAGDGVIAAALLLPEFGVKATAAMLGIPPSTVGTRAAQFRAKRLGSRARVQITPDDVRAIRAALAGGASAIALARRYGLTRNNIYAIKDRRTWKEVA